MTFLERLFHALFVLHPLHAMTVHFPIALTAVALFLIVLALWRRSEALEQAAFANISLAAVSTIAAAITGMRDNLNFYDGNAPNASAKIFLAISLLLLTTLTSVGRWRRRDLFWQPNTVVLYMAGYVGSFALAATLGFLGGVIVYGF